MYFLNYNNNLYVGNFLDKKITLSQADPSFSRTIEGCYKEINAVISYGTEGNLKDTANVGDFNQKNCIFLKNNLGEPDKIIVLELTIEGENLIYEVNLIPGQAEVIVISRENLQEDRKVFVEKQFIKGKKKK